MLFEVIPRVFRNLLVSYHLCCFFFSYLVILMVETRSSRRAAGEDSISSSQVQTARPRSQPAAEDDPVSARTPKLAKQAKHHANEGTASARTTSLRRTRLSSARSQAQTPSQAPRTRSRVRREAEGSIASSEAQRRPEEKSHPDEENSHVIRPVSSTRASTRRSQTRSDSVNDPKTQRKLSVATPMRLTRSAARRTRAAAEAAVTEDPSPSVHDLSASGSLAENEVDRGHVRDKPQTPIVPASSTEQHSLQHFSTSYEHDPKGVHRSPAPTIQSKRLNDISNSSVQEQGALHTRDIKEAEVEVIVIDDNDAIPGEAEVDVQNGAEKLRAVALSENDHETGEKETKKDAFLSVPQSNTIDSLPSDEQVYELDGDISKQLSLTEVRYDQEPELVDVRSPVRDENSQSRKKESDQGEMNNLKKSSYSHETECQTSSPQKETNVVLSESPHDVKSQESGVSKLPLVQDEEPNQMENESVLFISQHDDNGDTVSEEQELVQNQASRSPQLKERRNQTKKAVTVPGGQPKGSDVVSLGEQKQDNGNLFNGSPESRNITSPDHVLAKEVEEAMDFKSSDPVKSDKDNVILSLAESDEKPEDESIHTALGEPEHHQIKSVDQMIKLEDKMTSLFFRRDEIVSGLCRQLLQQTYARQTKLEFGTDSRYQFVPQRRKGLPPMGPLAQIEIDKHFDSGQLWEELELRNKPLLAHLQSRVKSILTKQRENSRALKRATINDESSGADESVGEQSEEERAEDIRSRENDSNKHENDDQRRITNDGEDMEERTKTVKFDLNPGEANTAEETGENRFEHDEELHRISSKKRKRQGLEDGFFRIEDMESFAAEAENLALSGKLIASDVEDDGDERWTESNSSEEEENENEDTTGRLLYSDFFDPPSKVEGKGTGAARALQLLDDDEIAGFGETEKLREDSPVNSTIPANASEPNISQATPLERSRSRTKRKIEAMEEASVSKKSWELRGEVSAFARPKDSLLDTDMQHDIAVKPKAFLTSEINETIEDVIKQRIVDGLFDDVVMQLPDAYIEQKRKGRQNELPDVSQEKPTEGLADLYAREFNEEREKQNKAMLASKEVQRDAEQPLTEQQQEVNKLFEKLSKKLDALSSMRFTPLSEDVKIDVSVKNVKAVTAEEAIPEGVSDANLLTPKEVFSVNKEEAVGEKEVTRDERRAARRMRKSRKRKRQAADKSKRQALAQTDPLLAEKRRAETLLLRRGKKPKLADKDPTVGGTQTKDLIKRFGGIKTAEEVETQPIKKSASHFRL